MSEQFDYIKSKIFIENEIGFINKSVIQYLETVINESDIGLKIKSINTLRSKTYEKLNQIQHEYFLSKAIDKMIKLNRISINDEIIWNPRQTGDSNEPDICIKRNGKIIMCCELTTSNEAKGKIDKRMKEVLEKLNKMVGEKIYIVVSEHMEKRAKTKIRNLGSNIEVMILSI